MLPTASNLTLSKPWAIRVVFNAGTATRNRREPPTLEGFPG
jgi:hypothetical protein